MELGGSALNTVQLTVEAPWAIAAAAFTNPMYLTAPLGATGNTQSTGFNLMNASELVIAFQGTYTGAAIAHEQTLDPAGVTGWFSVLGNPATGGSSSATGSTSGVAYSFPALGVQHRMKMTVLSTGTIEARVLLLGVGSGGGGAGGGGGGGGTSGGTATAADPSYAEGATGQALSLYLTGHLRVLDAAVAALLTTIEATLNTPASFMPPWTPVTSAANIATLTHTVVDITTATTTTVITATASQVTRVHKGILVIGGAQTVQIKSASTNLSGVMVFPASGGFINFNDDVLPELRTGTNEALTIVTTTTASVAGWIETIKGVPT